MIRLWDDTLTGSCRRTLEGHLLAVISIAFSPESQLVASTSFDFTVRVWEASTGSCRSTLKGHSNWVSAVAFAADGQLVASGGSNDSMFRLWDVATGFCRSTLKDYSRWVNDIAFSPDGSHLTTDRGQISLPSSLFDASSSQKRELCSIFVKDKWVTSAEQRLLWLPTDYRPKSIAASGNFLWLWHASSHITILQLKLKDMQTLRGNRVVTKIGDARLQKVCVERTQENVEASGGTTPAQEKIITSCKTGETNNRVQLCKKVKECVEEERQRAWRKHQEKL